MCHVQFVPGFFAGSRFACTDGLPLLRFAGFFPDTGLAATTGVASA
jgi:hypothetical protein